VDKHGISFHPTEFAYKDRNHYPPCSSASKDFKKMVPTVKQHFKLAKESSSIVSREIRLSQLHAIAKEASTFSPQQPVTSATAPSAAAGSTAVSENFASKPGAGRGQSGSSLFIQRPGNRVPMRKPSTSSKPTFLRAGNTSRPTPTSTQPRGKYMLHDVSHSIEANLIHSLNTASIQSILSGGSSGPGGSDDTSTPKGFIKPSKIQMIDINESAAIQETIDRANAGKATCVDVL
jgi:hypothetical protein